MADAPLPATPVVVVVADALPWPMLPVHGGELAETPRLDRLAVAGVVFEQCLPPLLRPAGWRPPDALLAALGAAEVPALLWTDLPAERKERPGGPWAAFTRLTEPSLDGDGGPAELLGRAADALADVDGDSLTVAELAVAGSDAYPLPAVAGRYTEGDAGPPWHRPPEGPVDALEVPAAEAVERIAAGWAERLESFDVYLGALLDAVAEACPGRPPLVVVTAREGYALGENGHVGRRGPLTAVRAQVPLLLAGPGLPEHDRFSGIVRPADVWELIGNALLGRPSPLADALRRGDADGPPWGLTTALTVGRGGAWCLRHQPPFALPQTDPRRAAAGAPGVSPDPGWTPVPAWHLVHVPGEPPRLYGKPADRFDAEDLAARNDEVLADLLERAGALAAAAVEQPPAPDAAAGADDGHESTDAPAAP